jgi:hypothetical protein
MDSNRFGIDRDPHFRAMAADRRKLLGCKYQVDIVERTPADQRQRAPGALMQTLERLRQAGRNPHFARRRRQIEQGTVNVEQNRGFTQMRHERARHRNGFQSDFVVR